MIDRRIFTLLALVFSDCFTGLSNEILRNEYIMRLLLRCGLAAVALCVAGALYAQNYTVSLLAFPQVNLTLEQGSCTAVARPERLLTGSFDADGDGYPAGPELFSVTVLDGDPSNGPVVDGCGTFNYVVAASPLVAGFTIGRGVITARAPVTLSSVSTATIPTSVERECAELASLPPGTIPTPRVVDLPTFASADGLLQVLPLGSSAVCNLSLEYSDSPPVFSCGQSFTLVRTFTIRDACTPLLVRSYTQTWLVTDRQAPVFTPPTQDVNDDGVADGGPLRFGTNAPTGCAARVRLDMPGLGLTDNCDGQPTIQAAVYQGTALIQAETPVLLSNATEEVTPPLSPGAYFIRYTYRDACGNRDFTDVQMIVSDATAPVATCVPDSTVQLAFTGPAEGIAVLTAQQIGGGSSDLCGEISLGIALVELNGDGAQVLGSGQMYGSALRLSCEDVGPVTVGLRATDASGNVSTCTTAVSVRGMADVVCQAPANVSLTCREFAALDLSQDLSIEPTDKLDAAFGAALAIGSCSDTIRQGVTGSLDDCGAGNFIRSFVVVQPDGQMSSNSCTQAIRVVAETAYTVAFPPDRNGKCTDTMDADQVLVSTTGCDLFVTTVTAAIQAGIGTECYNIAYTYRVLNLCEFDPAAAPIVIPRDFDNDGNTDEATYLHLFPNQPNILEDDVARLDEDSIRGNSGFTSSLVDAYGTDPGRGGFVYTQIVRVIDTLAPEVIQLEPITCFALSGDDCAATTRIPLSVTDSCTSPDDLGIVGELDENYTGQFERTRFLIEGEIVSDGAGIFTVAAVGIPEGEHAIRLEVTDECGNPSVHLLPVCVDNEVNAAPTCREEVTVGLRAIGGGNATGVLFASLFIPDNVDFCGEEPTYSVYTESEAGRPGFNPIAGREALILDCASEDRVPVRVYAFDPAGERGGYCSSSVNVQRPAGSCLAESGGLIGGTVSSVNGTLVGGVEVTLEGAGPDLMDVTTPAGKYDFTDLMLGQQYTVTPFLDDYSRHESGVTTADIVAITDAILAESVMNDPYEILAADVSNDRRVTVRDIIQIRRLILGLDSEYVNNTAYRFIKADYAFPIPSNPWATVFPEFTTVGNLGEPVAAADFLAVMIGDVTGNGFDTRPRTNPPTANLQMRQRTLDTQTIAISIYPGALRGSVGIQGTLRVDDGAEVIALTPGSISADQMNAAFLSDGLLPFAYHSSEGLPAGRPMFELRLRVTAGVDRAGLVHLTDDWLPREAVVADRSLVVPDLSYSPAERQELSLEVFPTVIVDRATVRMRGSTEETTRLTLYDASGRLVWRHSLAAGPGLRRVDLLRGDVGLSGVYFLQATRGGRQVTERIIIQ